MNSPHNNPQGTAGSERQRSPQVRDIIQTGMIYANGDGSVVWGTHQIIRRISSDGTLWFRPKDAKVDKCSQYWRFPIESIERTIKDLRLYANPKGAKEAIAILKAGEP